MKPNDLKLNVADRVEKSVRKLTTRLSTSVIEQLVTRCLKGPIDSQPCCQPLPQTKLNVGNQVENISFGVEFAD